MPAITINVVSVEEELCRTINLKDLIEKYCPGQNDVNTIVPAKEAVAVISYLKPDAVFVDNQDTYNIVIKNFGALLQAKDEAKKIALPPSQGISSIDIADIMYMEGDNNYTVFYTRDKKHLVSKTLKEFESLLSGSGFHRIHKSSIINLRHLKESCAKKLEVIMSDKKVLSISRRRASAFFDKAKQYND